MSVISYLTTVRFGVGALNELPELVEELGLKRPLVISDRGVDKAGLTVRATKLLPRGSPVFLDVPANPTEAATLAGATTFAAERCDGLVAIGRLPAAPTSTPVSDAGGALIDDHAKAVGAPYLFVGCRDPAQSPLCRRRFNPFKHLGPRLPPQLKIRRKRRLDSALASLQSLPKIAPPVLYPFSPGTAASAS